MIETVLKIAIAVLIPLASGISYVHVNFAPKQRVVALETVVKRVDKLICKMAIRQKLDSAEEICTD